MNQDRQIRVRITQIEMGFYRATSIDLPGLYAAAKTLKKLEQDLSEAIIDLLSADGQNYALDAPVQVDADTHLWRASPMKPTLRAAC